MLRSILLLASLALPSLATTPSYFMFNEVMVDIPQGPDEGSGYVGITIEDPASGNTTICSQGWQQGETIRASADWMECGDTTWSFRFDKFVSLTDWTVGVRHQYRGAGKPCLRSDGPQCVTRLGYGGFNSSVPDYSYYTPSSSSEDESGVDGAATDEPYEIPVYQTCTACGTNKIGSC